MDFRLGPQYLLIALLKLMLESIDMNDAISFIRLICCDGAERQHLCNMEKYCLLDMSEFRDAKQ